MPIFHLLKTPTSRNFAVLLWHCTRKKGKAEVGFTISRREQAHSADARFLAMPSIRQTRIRVLAKNLKRPTASWAFFLTLIGRPTPKPLSRTNSDPSEDASSSAKKLCGARQAGDRSYRFYPLIVLRKELLDGLKEDTESEEQACLHVMNRTTPIDRG